MLTKMIANYEQTKLTRASGAISRGSGKTRRLDQSAGSRDTTNDKPRMLVHTVLVTIAADDASVLIRRMMNQSLYIWFVDTSRISIMYASICTRLRFFRQVLQ